MRVAVIGAGCSGVTAVKACLEENIDVVCYERGANSGGLWWYRDAEDDDLGTGSVMRFTVCNTSKEMCVYSDYPPSQELPVFLEHEQMVGYIRDYADHFRVTPLIRFRHEVVHVSEDLALRVRNLETDEEFEETFDRVMVCSGHHSIPSIPLVPGREKFGGRVMHSREYKYSDENLRGKRVVVVGFGNSAVDMAVDMTGFTKQVLLSIRRANWVVPRHVGGVPIDVTFSKQLYMFFYNYVPIYVGSSWAWTPSTSCWRKAPVISSDLAERVLNGSIRFRGEIEAFTEQGVIMDGVEECVDMVVFATGYKSSVPFASDVLPRDGDTPLLYRRIFPPEHARVAFIGLFDRHEMMIDHVPYMEELASIMGIKPNFCRMLVTDPILYLAAVRAPMLNYRFRLQGPHAWPGARDAIMGYESRMKAPLKPPARLFRSERRRPEITLVSVVLLIVVLCLAVMLTSEFPLFSAFIWCAGALVL
ncbi:hypothetical protein HPB48_010303 [Haemaphysalis longicornis]|uniref:Flavin-containing monooxygenase n=1 Tax=Haemaphysalis longicornis TaxID=44386 RepID=A0A9J6FUS0_HAELO|nr:hypothetical protein HPB48_010303 [Haemaphysalis longicornis]